MENLIKEQQWLFSDRTSCHDWWPNQYRLLLAGLAYLLLEQLRRVYLKRTAPGVAEDRWCGDPQYSARPPDVEQSLSRSAPLPQARWQAGAGMTGAVLSPARNKHWGLGGSAS